MSANFHRIQTCVIQPNDVTAGAKKQVILPSEDCDRLWAGLHSQNIESGDRAKLRSGRQRSAVRLSFLLRCKPFFDELSEPCAANHGQQWQSTIFLNLTAAF